jgi:two-component sensor histidine kinase
VDFDEIADKVLAMCAEVATTGAPVVVRREGSFGVLPAEVATPMSMTLTELVQNAVEHAYPGGESGEIDVLVRREPDRVEVDVVDDGAGLPAGFDLQASTRLGLQIVRTLVAGELGGTLSLEPRAPRGTRARLSVPLPGPA